MSVKPKGLLGNIKIAHVFIIQCKVKICISILLCTFYIINQFYLIIFHATPSVILIKCNISFVMEVSEQPGSKTLLNITFWRHVNDLMQISITKERNWLTLTLLRLEVWFRSHDISMFCIEKCKFCIEKCKQP